MDVATFTAPFDREVCVSEDRQAVTHRAGAWSAVYTPADLLRWIPFYERLAEDPRLPHAKADVEVLRAARDLLASEAA